MARRKLLLALHWNLPLVLGYRYYDDDVAEFLQESGNYEVFCFLLAAGMDHGQVLLPVRTVRGNLSAVQRWEDLLNHAGHTPARQRRLSFLRGDTVLGVSRYTKQGGTLEVEALTDQEF